MKLDLLDSLKCPYCGGSLEIERVYRQHEDEIDTGNLKCACGRYPIVAGILDLRNGYAEEAALDFLDRGKAGRALALLLARYGEVLCQLGAFIKAKALPGRILSPLLSGFTRIEAQRTYRKYSRGTPRLFNLLGSNPWQTYLKFRFASQSLWTLYPFLPFLAENRGRILDLGGGMGHASFIIQQHVKPQELVCADHTFSSLYLAKQYVVSDAQFICLDTNHPLPFKDNHFDAVLALDMLHYVANRSLAASEIERVLLSRGCFLALHLHNSLQPNIAGGKPIPPAAWLNLFQKSTVRAFPDNQLIEDFLGQDRLDLTKTYTEPELNSSTTISITGTHDGPLFRVFDGVRGEFLRKRTNLIINPVYQFSHQGDKVFLKRRFPSEDFRVEGPVAEKYLPEQRTVPAALLDAGESGTINHTTTDEHLQAIIDDLMKEFVVINAPENYV